MVKDVHTYPGADIMSDHCLLLAKMTLKLKILKKSKPQERFDINLLKQNDYKEQFSVEVMNRFNILINDTPVQQGTSEERINSQWSCFKRSVQDAEMKVLPRKKIKKEKSWMTDEILELMERRWQKQNTWEYDSVDKQIKWKCKAEKEKWYNDQCKEIEDFERQHRMRELHEQVKKLMNKKRGIKTNSGAIKDKNGILLFDKQEVANRWEEYIKELYDDKARPAQKEPYETNGPDLMKEEINHAINSIKSGKVGGKDRILIEHLKALDDEALGIVHNLCQDIHATGHIPDDLRHSLFIKLPKKAKAMDCSQHHTISLMSHLMKVILKVILTRNERVLDSEIGETQAGFRSGLGTREGIFNLRAIFDTYLDVRKDVFICFIDYEKAFDHVYHHNLMNELNKYTIDGKDLNIMQNLYWNQTASIQLEDEESNQFSIK